MLRPFIEKPYQVPSPYAYAKASWLVPAVVVKPGDAALSDDSGVLVLPPDEAEAEARQATAKQASGLVTQQSVADGARLGDLSGATAMVLK
jgi:4-hydroxy-4-methyl-2-oxoglutarate aldolase